MHSSISFKYSPMFSELLFLLFSFTLTLCSLWQCGSLSVSQEEWQSDIQLISRALGSVYTCSVCHGSVCHAVNLWHWKDWGLQDSNLPTRYTLDPLKGAGFPEKPLNYDMDAHTYPLVSCLLRWHRTSSMALLW